MDPQLDHYLDQLEAQLAALSTQTRHDIRQEIRHHVLMLITEHQRRGMSEQTATTLALRQFGDPVRIGRDMQQTQKHTSFLRTSGQASGWFALVFLVNFIGFANGALLSHSVGMMFFMWSIVGGPLCGGIATGLTSRTRSMAAACLGFLVWVALFIPLVALTSRDEGEWVLLVMLWAAISLPLVISGTFVGQLMRKRLKIVQL